MLLLTPPLKLSVVQGMLWDAMSGHIQGSNLPSVVTQWFKYSYFLTWEWQRRLEKLNWDTSVGILEEGLSQRDPSDFVLKVNTFRLYLNAL